MTAVVPPVPRRGATGPQPYNPVASARAVASLCARASSVQLQDGHRDIDAVLRHAARDYRRALACLGLT